MRQIAIIGSGPAGCYLADHLLRLAPDARIDVIERLPVPFGLVRYGVAPDHQSTKAVVRVLDRVLARDRIGYFGNLDMGRDLRLDELRSLYDAVVLATGAPRDRSLGIAGEDLAGVVGSGAFVGWYNGHPDHGVPPLRDLRSAVVVGNGNVAIDVVRVLAKSPAEMAGSDLAPAVLEVLAAQPIETLHIVGRRGPADAKFTEHELAELGALARACPVLAEPAAIAGDTANVEVLRGFAAQSHAAPIDIVFHFWLAPVAFLGADRLEAVRFARFDGSTQDIAAQLAVTCIGYRSVPCCGIEPVAGVFANQDGRIDAGLYVTGWAKRGPSGTIPTNRAEAQQVAQKVAAETRDQGRAGGEGLAALLAARGVRRVDYAAWRSIDAAERAGAASDRCRRKFDTVAAMLQAGGV
ncbi:MAG: Ferredoxin--NADP(+) reductase, actinobacterial (eukaryote-like) type [Burkholderiaceae bacterium]|jgi:ferredoxin--NADP+ reductase|nr:MAG: Ferredoxin--NADP(+) reductase, actinobacterial (eukaryote-like) type [Burkholderiaceae bacterium]